MAKFKMKSKQGKIKPFWKTEKGMLYAIDGMKGLYKIKGYDKGSKRFIFEKAK